MDNLIYSDNQYEIKTALDVNGMEHAKNFMEVSFGALKDFANTTGLSKDEAVKRAEELSAKCAELVTEFKASFQ